MYVPGSGRNLVRTYLNQFRRSSLRFFFSLLPRFLVIFSLTSFIMLKDIVNDLNKFTLGHHVIHHPVYILYFVRCILGLVRINVHKMCIPRRFLFEHERFGHVENFIGDELCSTRLDKHPKEFSYPDT